MIQQCSSRSALLLGCQEKKLSTLSGVKMGSAVYLGAWQGDLWVAGGLQAETVSLIGCLCSQKTLQIFPSVRLTLSFQEEIRNNKPSEMEYNSSNTHRCTNNWELFTAVCCKKDISCSRMQFHSFFDFLWHLNLFIPLGPLGCLLKTLE